MDKYEYKVRSEEISKLIQKEKYAEAVKIADTIDWRRVKSVSMLLKIAALYRISRRNDDSREMLMLAYDRYPTNRSVVHSLCELSIELDDVVAAIEYYKQFVKLAPKDNGVYTLRYRILEAQEASLEERIDILEELKKKDYQEEWAYELAYLYHRVGLSTKCVEECDDIILWFGDGPYVMKAMELKAKHVPLTSIQQKNYGIMLGNSRQNYSAQSYDAGDGSAQDYGNDTYDPGQNYAAEGYGEQGYGTAGYDSQNYSSENYDSPNYGEAGYAGQNREEAGYGDQNYGGGSYAGENYGTTGYGDQNYNSENYETSGYGGQNYDSENYAASGYSDQNYNNENYEASGYDSQNYNNENYGTSGYGDQNYNNENYEASGYGGQNYTNENYEASGYGGQNYNRERYEASNYGGQNYNDENYEASGYGSQSYTNENYEASGYGGQNYAGESYDTQNYKASGYGSENYNGQNEPAPDGDGYGSYGQNNFVDDGYGNLSYVDNSYRDGGFTGEFYVEQAYDENGNLISPELYADDADGAQERYDYVQDNSAQGAVGSGSTSREYRNGLRLVENTAPPAGTSSDMSQYNTINLQKVVAESMKELFPDEDGDVFAEDREKYNAGAKLDNTAGDTRIFGSLAGYGVKDSRGPKATLAQNSQGGADALREELTQTGKVAQMVTGVSEKAPAPHTGAIRKVLVPGDDARLIKSDSNIDELRDTTEKSVDDEHIRMEYNDENVYHDQNLTDAAVQSQTTGSMDLGEVLVAWQRMKQDSARKNQEEIKQRVQSQTGRIFIDFDNSIKSGILGELEREEAQAKRDSQAENSARKRKTARDGFLDADITSDIPQTPTAEDDFDVAYTTEQSRPAAAQAAVQPASDTVHRPGPTDAGARAQGTRAVRADNAGNERVETDMYPVDEAVTKTQDTTAQEYLADAVEMGSAEDMEDAAEAQADLYADLYIEELGAEQTDGRGLDEDSAAAHLQEETAVYENALHRTQESTDLAAGAESTAERARAVDDLQELSEEEENPNPQATESGKEINCPQEPALSEGYGEGAGDENARNYPQESASSEGYDEEAGDENARNYIQEPELSEAEGYAEEISYAQELQVAKVPGCAEEPASYATEINDAQDLVTSEASEYAEDPVSYAGEMNDAQDLASSEASEYAEESVSYAGEMNDAQDLASSEASEYMEESSGYGNEINYTQELAASETSGYDDEMNDTQDLAPSEASGYAGETDYTQELAASEASGYADEMNYTQELAASEASGYADEMNYTQDLASSEAAGYNDEINYTQELASSEAAGYNDEINYTQELASSEASGYAGEMDYTQELMSSAASGYTDESSGYAGEMDYTQELAPSEASGYADKINYTQELTASRAGKYAEEPARYKRASQYTQELVTQKADRRRRQYKECQYDEKALDPEEAEDIAEMAKEDALKTQEIKMNTADLSSLSEKIVATTKKEARGAKREELREFTPEEQTLFENFAVTRKIKKQILQALDQMTLAAYIGNVIITGDAGLDTIRMAKNLMKVYQTLDENFSGKLAKITGEKINQRNIKDVFEKLHNGGIIIEKANGMSEEKLYELATNLNQDTLGIVVIMEDTKKEITKLLEKQAMIVDYFNIRIDLMEMDNNALVAYAKNYALALEYSIDELGTLALYTRIANMQSGNHVVTKDEVRDIIDEAIWKSKKSKIKNFVDVLFARRYDNEDMIVLKERDFM